MFAPPSDLNLVGYGANLRLVIAASPMTFWQRTIPDWNTCRVHCLRWGVFTPDRNDEGSPVHLRRAG
jgi:hypothetical protein